MLRIDNDGVQIIQSRKTKMIGRVDPITLRCSERVGSEEKKTNDEG